MGNNKRKLLHPTGHSIYFVLCLSALLFFGVMANSVLVSINSSKTDSESENVCSIDISCFPDGDGSMTKNESSAPGKVYHLTIPAVVGGCGVEKKRPVQKIIEVITPPKVISAHLADYAHTSSVCPQKAREFTLVGAKPSGTS